MKLTAALCCYCPRSGCARCPGDDWLAGKLPVAPTGSITHGGWQERCEGELMAGYGLRLLSDRRHVPYELSCCQSWTTVLTTSQKVVTVLTSVVNTGSAPHGVEPVLTAE
jgi:hypothetical protein